MINVFCSQFLGQALVQLSKQTRNSDFAIQFVFQLANQEAFTAGYLVCDGRDKKCQS
jgi:hypothetical protein